MYNALTKNSYLVKELTLRDINSRYKGSMLGIFLALLTPLAMLLVFSFVFGEVFQAKWPGNDSLSRVDFSINLFIGLSVFWFFADVIGRAPTVFSSVPNYVKKVIFPLEILPFVNMLSALFHFFIYIVIILAALLLNGTSLSINILYVIPIIIITLPMLTGAGLLFGSLGVYAKDIGSLIGVLMNVLMFLSPVFYPLSAIPKKLHWLFEMNPLTLIIEELRGVLMQGNSPSFVKLAVYFIISSAIFMLGYKVFKLTKKGFADVI